ncbi:AAA domain-containing protein [Flammula alnicola]|nr:AAA domain-containing protein [Flammula alnicola]
MSIYIIGPSSTGKTTLCDALGQKLAMPKHAYVKEVARQVMKDKGYSRDTIASVQMQKDIMDAHFQREDRLDAIHCPIRLFDRSAIDPIVYAILTSGSTEEARLRQAFLTESNEFQGCSKDTKWLVDDGVRSTENQQECIEIFKRLLKELGVHYYEFGSEMKFLQERVVVTMGLAKF